VQSQIARTRHDLIEVTVVVVEDELEAGTDAALLAEGYATVTKVRSVSAVEPPRATPPT
jgi:5'-nucleotidase